MYNQDGTYSDEIHKIYGKLTNKTKEVINVLEYDEYRLKLQGFEDSINDLRDSL